MRASVDDSTNYRETGAENLLPGGFAGAVSRLDFIMPTTLQYGADRTLTLDVDTDILVAELHPHGEPVSDLQGAVESSLAEPLGFPALKSMVLPDDRVVLPLEPRLTCAAELVAGLVHSLIQAGTPAERICLLRTVNDRGVSDRQVLSCLESSIQNRLQRLRYDPELPGALSYLAASRDDHPIYLSRELVEADVVIPIGSLQGHDPIGCLGVHHGWYPHFADAETQKRFYKSQSTLVRSELDKRRAECLEAAWQLGIQMTLQVVPAGNNQALRILAGNPEKVWEEGISFARKAWQFNVERRASLVVCGIGGGPEQQTWQNVARGLMAALEVVEENGAIAVCCDLKTKPGPALRQLAETETYEEANRAIARRSTPDALSARRLNQVMQRARVYLLSQLTEEEVESLGMGYVSDPHEVEVLSSRHPSLLVMENAQHAKVLLGSAK